MIRWDEIVLSLRRYKPLSKIAKEIGIDAGTLRRIARGDTLSPKYEQGVEILKMHKALSKP